MHNSKFVPMFQKAGPYVLVAVGLALVAFGLRYATKKFRFLLPSKKVFLQNILRAMGSADHGFDSALGLESATVIGYERGELTVQLTIPASLSLTSLMMKTKNHKTQNAVGELGVGAVLALADVFTTLVLLAGDSNHRPGVSISLTGEVFKSVLVGQSVTIKARILKIGANLGFTEMWVYDERNEPVARAKHIKYLQMGMIWDFLGFLLPIIVNVYNYKNSPKAHLKSKRESAQGPGQSIIADTLGANVFKKDSDQISWYQANDQRLLKNLYGFMHGGAICCLMELCILDSFQDSSMFSLAAGAVKSAVEPPRIFNSTRNKQACEPLRYLEVSFLSPCKGSLEVGIEHHSLGKRVHELNLTDTPDRPVGCLAGKVYSSKDAKKSRLLVEASYSY